MEFLSASESLAKCVEGSRIVDKDGFKGTIRYVGPVASAKNDDKWVGIEWDNVTRGKHDGSVVDANGNTHRYYSCESGAGSFVKPNTISFGISFITALRDRYVDLDAPQIAPDNILPDAFVTTAKGQQKSIEFVGETKIRKRQQLNEVTKIAIRAAHISHAGEAAQISTLASHFIDVDLQDNLFSSWMEIASITCHMPHLDVLSLHGNHLRNLPSTFPTEAFQSLRVLALNRCRITSWDTVRHLAVAAPHLQELYLASNTLPIADTGTTLHYNYSLELESPIVYPSLHTLDLSSCAITNFLEVLRVLAPLTSLEELLLDNNDIASVCVCPDASFSHLKRISLSSTQIASWSDVDALSTFPSHCTLRLTHIPLFSGKGSSEVRPLVIARIQNLTQFNGSTVSARERVDAEKMYVRSAMREIQNGVSELTHPRYAVLYAKYKDELLQFGAATGSNQTLASEVIEVTFHNMCFNSKGYGDTTTKNLPATVSVDRLKLMIKQLFAVDPSQQVLSLKQYSDSIPTIMEDDSGSLAYYGAANKSHIYVSEVETAK